MNTPRQNQFRCRAFTLIELLVVMAIIGILASLILAGAGSVMAHARKSRAQSERDALILAIDSFKKDKGFYPPDNTNNPAQSPLYYELTGSFMSNVNTPGLTFVSLETLDQLTVPNVQAIFGRSGFINTSPDKAEVRNFVRSTGKGSVTGTFATNGANYVLFGVQMSGPAERNTATGARLIPWSYVSTNPTNNTDSYDLWVDVSYSGRINRISNWSPEPQPQ